MRNVPVEALDDGKLRDTAAAAAAKSLQSCPPLCDPTDAAHQAPRPWDSPGKNTGVGCHFLLQCMKVKSESEVAQSCPTLHDPMDCCPPGSSAHGIFQARALEWGAIAFSNMRHRLFRNFFKIIYGCSGSLLLCPSFSLVAARGRLLIAREHRL